MESTLLSVLGRTPWDGFGLLAWPAGFSTWSVGFCAGSELVVPGVGSPDCGSVLRFRYAVRVRSPLTGW